MPGPGNQPYQPPLTPYPASTPTPPPRVNTGGVQRSPGPLSREEALQVLRTAMLQEGGVFTPEQIGSGSIQEAEARLSALDSPTVTNMAMSILRHMPASQRSAFGQSINSKFDESELRMNQPTVIHSPQPTPQVEAPPQTTPWAAPQGIMQTVFQEVNDEKKRYQEAGDSSIASTMQHQDNLRAIYSPYINDLLSQSADDPSKALTAQTLTDYLKADMGILDSRMSLQYKMGADNADNAIRRMSLQLQENTSNQNAFVALANLGLERQKFIEYQLPQLELAQARYNNIELPRAKMQDFTDLYKLAFDTASFDVTNKFRAFSMLEGIATSEINRQDTARAAIMNAQAGLASFMATNATRIAEVALKAGDQFLQMLPNIITPANENRYLPGYEPGGPQQKIAQMLGTSYQPLTYGDTRVTNAPNPYDVANQLRSDLGAAQAMYPQPTMNDLAPPAYHPGMDYLSNGDWMDTSQQMGGAIQSLMDMYQGGY